MKRNGEFNDNLISNPDGILKQPSDVGQVSIDNVKPGHVKENSLSDLKDTQSYDEVARNTNVEKGIEEVSSDIKKTEDLSKAVAPLAQSTQNLNVALTGLTAISSTIGAVATAVVATVIVVGAAVQTQPFNADLIMQSYDSLTFLVEGGEEEQPVRAVLVGDDESYYAEIFEDHYVVFSNLRENSMYTLTIVDSETSEVYFEKNYSTIAYSLDNVSLEIGEIVDEKLSFSVAGFTLGVGEYYTISVTDNAGKEIYSVIDTEENKVFTLDVEKLLNIKVTVSIGRKTVCFKDILLDEFRTPIYDYSNINWNWSDDYTASATVTDLRRGTSVPFETTVSSVTNPATCEAAGEIIYTATIYDESRNPYSDSRTQVLFALGHDYASHEFVWSDIAGTGDGTAGADSQGFTCAVTFTCGRDGCGHKETVDATVTDEITVRCEEDGSIVYHAAIEFEGQQYFEDKVITLPPVGHNYGEPTFEWTEEEDSGEEDVPLYSATAVFVCGNDASHVERVDAEVSFEMAMPTDSDDGWVEYYAFATFDGVEYRGTKMVVLPALGHDYGEPDFEWTPVYDVEPGEPVIADNPTGYTAVAIFTCLNDDCEHYEEIEATVTVDDTTVSCDVEGTIYYTASVTLDGVTYTDVYEQSVFPRPHELGEPEYHWTRVNTGDAGAEPDEGTPNYTCEAWFVCEKCGEHITLPATSVNAVLNNEGTEIIGFTATFEYNDDTYTDTKTLEELSQ